MGNDQAQTNAAKAITAQFAPAPTIGLFAVAGTLAELAILLLVFPVCVASPRRSC